MRPQTIIILKSLIATSATLAGPCDPATLLVETEIYPLSSGGDPRRIIAHDLDADLDLDLVVAQYGSDRISIHLGNGDGTFAPAVEYTTSDGVGNGPEALGAADFNGDGHLDLAVGNIDSTLTILLGDSTGSFTPGGVFNSGLFTLPSDMVVDDFDHDGDPDIAVNGQSNSVYVSLNNGDATFATPVFYPVINGTSAIESADLNNDTNPDLVVTTLSTNKVQILYGLGNGAFISPVDFETVTTPDDVQIGDMDNDGDLDLIVSTYFHLIGVHLNDGNGNFSSRIEYPCDVTPSDIKLGDMDSDGDLDVMVATLSSNPASIALLINDGNGALSPQYDFFATDTNGPRGVSIGDFNGDGAPDVAVAFEVANRLHIFENTCAQTTCSCNPADLADPCGVLNFFDVSAFLVAYNAQDPIADFNADGMVNFFDVSAFLTAFNNGCP